MKIQSTFYPDFISKIVDILIISSFITKKCPNFLYLMHLRCWFFTHFLRCKTFSLKIWLCKIFDKFHICPRVRCAFDNVSFLRSHLKIANVSARSAHNMEALLKELALRVLGSAVSFRCLGNSRCSKLEAVITNKQRPYFADFVSRNEKSPPSS